MQEGEERSTKNVFQVPHKGSEMMYEAPRLAICLDGEAIGCGVLWKAEKSMAERNKNAKLITIISSGPLPEKAAWEPSLFHRLLLQNGYVMFISFCSASSICSTPIFFAVYSFTRSSAIKIKFSFLLRRFQVINSNAKRCREGSARDGEKY